MSSSKSSNGIPRANKRIKDQKKGKQTEICNYLGILTEKSACKEKSKLDDYDIYLYHRIPDVKSLTADDIPSSIPLCMVANENRLLLHPHYAGKKTEKEMSSLGSDLIQLYHRIPSIEEISAGNIPETIPLFMVAPFGQENFSEVLDKSSVNSESEVI
uniref:Uncharacterized protein n=1 Tax=Ditylenchus dipsaci TaxID=166011 RepID=A0A915CMW8_9BILA